MAVLRNIHKTHPDLFNELTSNDDDVSAPSTEHMSEPELFTDHMEDDSDIPLHVLKDHLTSDSTLDSAFFIATDGSIKRNSATEDTEFSPGEEAVASMQTESTTIKPTKKASKRRQGAPTLRKA